MSLATLTSDELKLVLSYANLMDVLMVCSASRTLVALLSQLQEIRMNSIGYAARTALRPKAGLGRMLKIETLRVVVLSSLPNFTLGHARLLAAALRRGAPALTVLGLPQSHMGGDCATVLAPAIGASRSLITVDLSHCGLQRKGTKAVIAALRTNTSITKLDVSGNMLRVPSRGTGSESVALIDACADHPALSDLNLAYNGLDAGDTPAIGRLLSAGRIRTLGLQGNRLFGRTAYPGLGPNGPSQGRPGAAVIDGAVRAFADALAGDGTPLPAVVVDIEGVAVSNDGGHHLSAPEGWQDLLRGAASNRGLRLLVS